MERVASIFRVEEKAKQETTLKAAGEQISASYLIQPTTRRYIPENRTLLNHRCENLKSLLQFRNTVWCYC
jgi:hypothetical protein